MKQILTDDTFILYAAKYYDNPQCESIDEFYEDLRKIQYLKRLFIKYEETGELRERLILNHIIVLYNLFGEHTTNLLFFKLYDYRKYLKPFVELLGYMPVRVDNLFRENNFLYSKDIETDLYIKEVLRKL